MSGYENEPDYGGPQGWTSFETLVVVLAVIGLAALGWQFA